MWIVGSVSLLLVTIVIVLFGCSAQSKPTVTAMMVEPSVKSQVEQAGSGSLDSVTCKPDQTDTKGYGTWWCDLSAGGQSATKLQVKVSYTGHNQWRWDPVATG